MPEASVPPSSHGGSLSLPLSPIGADRVRPVTVIASLVAAGVLLLGGVASAAPATPLLLTLGLALVLAWAWPVLGGSSTPTTTAVVLGVAAVAIVLTALREDLRWTAGAVALGIVLSFFAQLTRRTGRDGLVLTLLASFGGLVPIASATSAVVVADEPTGRSVLVVGMAAAVAAVLADLLAGVRRLEPFLGLVALVAAVGGALAVASTQEGLGIWSALGIGAAVGTVSWTFRRVLSLQPAMVTVRGQLAAGIASILVTGVLVRLFVLVS